MILCYYTVPLHHQAVAVISPSLFLPCVIIMFKSNFKHLRKKVVKLSLNHAEGWFEGISTLIIILLTFCSPSFIHYMNVVQNEQREIRIFVRIRK